MFSQASIRLFFLLGVAVNAVLGVEEADRVWLNSATDAEIKTAILDEHNSVRRSVAATDMRKMVWDDELEAIAQGWADQCKWSHNGDRSKDSTFGYVGENKYLSAASNIYVQRPVEYWELEAEKYDYTTMSCSSGICTHYTQVVWADSYALGCGINWCDSLEGLSGWSGTYVVCNYGPGGNWEGKKPYGKDECSSCPDEADNCDDGLCSETSTFTLNKRSDMYKGKRSDVPEGKDDEISDDAPSTNE